MNELSSEQLDDLLRRRSEALPGAGVATDDAEVEHWHSAFESLRLSATRYAEAERRQMPAKAVKARVLTSAVVLRWAPGMALAAAVLSAVLWLPELRHSPATAPANPAAASRQATPSDDALLDSIHDDLSTTVPEAMQPLAVYGSATSVNSAARKN